MLERWNTGILDLYYIALKNIMIHEINQSWIEINKGQPFVWECHDCHQGAVILGTYKNIHRQVVKTRSRHDQELIPKICDKFA